MSKHRCVGGPLHGKILEVDARVLTAPHWTAGYHDYVGEPSEEELGVEVVYQRQTLVRRNEEGTRQIVETVMAPRALHPGEVERLWKTLPPDEETVDHQRYNPQVRGWESVDDEVQRLRRRVSELEEANDAVLEENKRSKRQIRSLRATLARCRLRSRRTARIADEGL